MTMELSNVRNKRILSFVTKVQSQVMLVLSNVIKELSNVSKNRVPLNVIKIQSDVILILSNVTMEPSNVRKKKRGTTKCDKRTVTCDVGTCDVGTAQREDETVKCEKKINEPLKQKYNHI